MASWRRIIPMMVWLGMAAGVGAFEFSTADYAASDVNIQPSLPVAGQPARFSIRLRNTGAEVLPAGKVTITAVDGAVVGEAATPEVPKEAERYVAIAYTPEANGYHQFQVKIELAGTDYVQNYTVPVVSRNIYIPWFGAKETLRYATLVMVRDAAENAYWRNRGAITCLWKGVILELKTPQAYADYLKEGLDAEPSPDGIMIDEMGNYTDAAIQAMSQFQGLKLFTQTQPEEFVALWICGSLRQSYCNITRNLYRKTGVNLLLLECYANFLVPEFKSYRRYDYFDQRIAMAREQDVMSNTVMTLGISDNQEKFNLTPYEIEDEIRYVKRHAPEMPGIGFFHANGSVQEMVTVADALSCKYYIEPVVQIYPEDLQLSELSPKAGDTVRLIGAVYNLGGMDAHGVTVRFLLDGKLVAEQLVDIPAVKDGEVPRPARLEVPVTLPEARYYEARVELHAPQGVTVLDGIVTRSFPVAQK